MREDLRKAVKESIEGCMHEMMATSIEYLTATYDKHLSSLERSRDAAQESVTELIRANLSLQQELQQEQREHREQMKELRADYRRLLDKYTRLAEHAGVGGAGASQEIHIGK